MITVLVRSEEQLEEALENGWSLTPPEVREERFSPLPAILQAEVEQVDALIRRPRKPEVA
jgi:hypothetical protein